MAAVLRHQQNHIAVAPLRIHPYRLFFPLGAVCGLLGVGVWVFFSVGWTVPNVSRAHVMLQTQGFLASFAFGFLLTAFPRFLGAPPAPGAAVAGSFAAMLAYVGATVTGHFQSAQVAFLVAFAFIAFAIARSLARRTKPLVGSFALVGFGLAHAVAGAALIIVSREGDASAWAFATGRQMVQLGFLLCAVLGIAGKLAPFLMGHVDDHPALAPRAPGRLGLEGWVHVIAGALIAASFLAEASFPRAAAVVRASVVAAHLALFARAFRLPRKRSATAVLFAASLWFVAAGLVAAAAFPLYRVAALHLTFVGGFSLMIFSFGSLVVLSHSGNAKALNGRLAVVWTVGGLVLASLALRLIADTSANHYMRLLQVSSSLWVSATLVWLVWMLPKLKGNEIEEEC